MAEIPVYDAQGRPSCGELSAYYASGGEVPWTDSRGRPSSGVGSGEWWARDGSEGWRFDHRAIPSCGPNSKLYGAEPAIPQVETVVAQVTQANNSFTTISASGGVATRAHSGGLPASILVSTTDGGRVRDLTGQWTIVDTFGSPVLRPLAAVPLLPGIAPEGDLYVLFQVPQIPVGCTATLTITADVFVPTDGTALIVSTIRSAGETPSPNGGVFPSLDSAGRPACGPGSGHYGDRTLVLDGSSRPSCGPGSAHYLDGAGVDDWAGRPSCGVGSETAFGAPAVPQPGTIVGPTWNHSSVGTQEWIVIVDAGQLAKRARFDMFTGLWGAQTVNFTPESAKVEVLSYPKAVTAGGGTGTVATVDVEIVEEGRSFVAYPSPGYQWWSSEIPQLPADANSVGPVTLRLEAKFQPTFPLYFGFPLDGNSFGFRFNGGPGVGSGVAGSPWGEGGFRFLPGSDGWVGLNGGVQADCASGPNGGVDVPCAGPNGGVDVNCPGSDIDCGAGVAGPNGGLDRVAVTECVTELELCPTWVRGGWPNAWATSDLPHPASTAAGALCIVEGDRLEGLISPTGRVPWHASFDSLPYVCVGSTILAVRLKIRVKTAALWTLAAVDPATQQIYGGWIDDETQYDGATTVYVPLDIRNTTDLSNMRVIGDFASGPGGTPGWVEQCVLQVQFVGGDGCRDCGPNGGTPRPCAATSAVDPAPVTATAAWCGLLTPPAASEMVPIIHVTAGTEDVLGVRIRFFPRFLSDDDLPCVSAEAWERWNCLGACGEVWIPELAAGEEIVIDDRAEEVWSITGPVYDGHDRVFANRYLHAYRPHVLNCVETVVLVEVLNGASYDPDTFRVTVDGAIRTLNGGA